MKLSEPHVVAFLSGWSCSVRSVECMWLCSDLGSVKNKSLNSMWFKHSPLLSITVLHGHVHCVCAVRGSLALLVCLLLEGSAADPVLDRRRHHTWHAGKSCVLLGIPEHPLQRRLRSVDFIYLIVCGILFLFSFFLYCYNRHFVCVSSQFKGLWFLLSCSLHLKDLSPESWSSLSVLAMALSGTFLKLSFCLMLCLDALTFFIHFLSLYSLQIKNQWETC